MVSAAEKFIAYFAVLGPGESLKSTGEGEEMYASVIEQRFPLTDYKDAPLPEHLPVFSYPVGIRLVPKEIPPQFFCFTLTELSGERLYCACLQIYERLTPQQLSKESTMEYDSLLTTTDDDTSLYSAKNELSEDEIEEDCFSSIGASEKDKTVSQTIFSTQTDTTPFIARSLCILSRYPFFSTFRECLRELFLVYRTFSPLPIECYVQYLTQVLPLPQPGQSVQFKLFHRKMGYSLPSNLYFPLTDFSIHCLFQILGVSNTLDVFSGILGEHKTVFISKHYTMLTIAAEAITQLMLPFKWHHIFIPILPCTLLAFAEAPTPYIIGIHSDFYHELESFHDVNIVDLNEGSITLTDQSLLFPSHIKKEISQKINNILHPQLLDMDAAFPRPTSNLSSGFFLSPTAMNPLSGDHHINTELKLIFLYFFISLFKEYRQYLSFIRKFPLPVTIFNKAKYMKKHPEEQEFLSAFLETQAFLMFLEIQHKDQEFSVFEEIIREMRRGTPHESLIYDFGPQHPTLVVGDPVELYGKQESYRSVLEAYKATPTLYFPKIRMEMFPEPLRREEMKWEDTGSTETKKKEKTPQPFVEGSAKAEFDNIHSHSDPFIAETIERILLEQPVAESHMNFLSDLLKLESSRIIFVLCLKEYQSKGNVANLKEVYYNKLVAISRVFLQEANDHSDFASPAIFIHIFDSFKNLTDECIITRLRDLAIWKNKYFWEAAFFESVAADRAVLDDEYKVGKDVGVVYEELESEEQKKRLEVEANLLFGVLGSFGYHMLKTGVSASEASSFVLQMCRLCDLDHAQTNDLQTLISNLNSLNNELDMDENVSANEQEQKESNGQEIKLQYFSSTKRLELDSTALYRRLVEQKGDKKHFDYSDEINQGYAVRTLYGHKAEVTCISLCYPKLASGSLNGGIRLWDLQKSSYSTFTFQSHTDRITEVLVNQDVIISASRDTRVIVWSQDTGAILHDFGGHTGPILSISLKNKFLLSASEDSTVRMWDTVTGECVSFSGHTDAVMCVKWMDSNTFVTCSKDKTIRIWDVKTKECAFVLQGHSDWVKTIFYDPIRHRIVSSSFDCTLRIWDAKTGDCLQALLGHTGVVQCFSCFQNVLVSGSSDRSIRVWDMESGECSFVLHAVDEVVTLKISPSTDLVFAGGFDSSIKIWNYTTGKLFNVLTGHTDCSYSLLVYELPKEETCDDKKMVPITLISGSWDSTVKIWERKTKVKRERRKKFAKIFNKKAPKSAKDKHN